MVTSFSVLIKKSSALCPKKSKKVGRKFLVFFPLLIMASKPSNFMAFKRASFCKDALYKVAILSFSFSKLQVVISFPFSSVSFVRLYNLYLLLFLYPSNNCACILCNTFFAGAFVLAINSST